MAEYRDLLEKYVGVDSVDETLEEINQKAKRLLSRGLDFSELMKDLSCWESLDVDSLTEWIHLKLSCSEELAGFDINVVLESLILKSLGEYVESKDVPALEKLGQLIHSLDIAGYIDKTDLEAEFEYPLQSPAVSLSLHRSGLMEMGSQLDVPWRSREKQVKMFLEDWVQEVAGGAGSEITQLLVSVAFSNQHEEDRKKKACALLEKMTGKILDKVRSGDSINLRWLGNLQLPDKINLDWKLFCLSLLMRHRPEIKMSDAFSSHQALRAALSPTEGLGSLCSGLVSGGEVSAEQITGLVGRVIYRAEINWGALLSIVSLALQKVPRMDEHLSRLLRELVKESLSNQNSEALLAGLLLSRHSCLEQSAFFPSYAAWCASLYAEENALFLSSTVAQFFYRELTGLVPDEPEFALRAHIAHHPKVPHSLKHLADDYRQLARTRLLDSGNLQSSNIPNILAPEVINLAQEIIGEWGKTKKIPSRVNEANMFKQPYYISQLLPALMLAYQEGSELFVLQGKLLEALNSRGIVPGHLYKEYLSGELQERFSPAAEPIANLSTADSGVSVENLRETLQILTNLPIDFKEEIESSLTSVRQITGSLVRGSRIKVTPELVQSSCPCPTTVEVFNSLSLSFLRTNFPEIREKLVGLILGNSGLLLLGLQYILEDCVEDRHLDLLATLLQTSPSVHLHSGDTLNLEQFLGSQHHRVTSHLQLENLRKILLTVRSKYPSVVLPNNWMALINLENYRRWIKHQEGFPVAPLSSAELCRVLPLQLGLTSDSLSKSELVLLFSKLLEAAGMEEESQISRCLDLVCSDRSSPDQSGALLAVLSELNPGLLIKLSHSRLRTPNQAKLLLEAVVQADDPLLVQPLQHVAELCREDWQLFTPLSAVQHFAEEEPRSLSAGLRFGLANYSAAGLLRSSWSAELEREFSGVYGWFRDPAEKRSSSLLCSTIKFGLLRLGEIYLRDPLSGEEKSPNQFSQEYSITNQLKQLAKHLTYTDEKRLVEPVKDWFPESISSSICGATQIALVKSFFGDLSCSLRFLLEELLPIYSAISSSGVISLGQRSLLTKLLMKKLPAFTPSQIGEELVRVKQSCVDKDIYQILAQYSNIIFN